MVLRAGTMPHEVEVELAARFTVIAWPEKDEAAQAALLQSKGPAIAGIATTPRVAIPDSLIAACPALRVIACLGAGLDRIDLAAAQARGVTVTGTSEVLADDVADLAVGLLLAAARRLVEADRFVREGRWPDGPFGLGASLRDLKVGIVGLGRIGTGITTRLASFGCELAYYGPHRKAGPIPYFRDIVSLARWADALILACPGGKATERLVDASVLAALGARGMLVNVARGSVVDETALAAAVAADDIGMVALDVHAREPHPHAVLFESPRTILLPHLGSATVTTRARMAQNMFATLHRYLDRA